MMMILQKFLHRWTEYVRKNKEKRGCFFVFGSWKALVDRAFLLLFQFDIEF